MRDSSIFYRSFYEAINDLPEENQLAVYKSIFEYTLNFNEIPLTGISKTIFTLIKPQLDANNKKFANGKKGGRPIEEKQTETKKEPKENQTESKPKTNENVNDNENEKDNENKNDLPPSAKQKSFKVLTEKEFGKSLEVFIPEFGRQTIRSFFDYWTEKSPTGKMKFQLGKTWDSKRRLKTWKSNEPKFGKEPVKEQNYAKGPWN